MNTPSLTSHVVVVDITPDTGRMVIVTLSGGSLSTTEVHRFEHHSDRHSTHSVNHLVTEIIAGLRIVNLELSSAKATVSISACGGDYVCLTPQRDIVSAREGDLQPTGLLHPHWSAARTHGNGVSPPCAPEQQPGGPLAYRRRPFHP